VAASSSEEFEAAVHAYRFDPFDLDRDAIALARKSVEEAGLLVVGEPHGVYETPSALYWLATALDTRAVAFEWSHEELHEVVQSFGFERLWSLPETAEVFSGDGRFTAGHFALLQRLRDEERLEQVIVYDRLDPVPQPDDWRIRDAEMAERLLAEWRGAPLLVLTGAFHATLEDGTMASHLARERPGLQPLMLQYENRPPMPPAPITLRLPRATPALVPTLQSGGETKT
jgi:hypothetical protein